MPCCGPLRPIRARSYTVRYIAVTLPQTSALFRNNVGFLGSWSFRNGFQLDPNTIFPRLSFLFGCLVLFFFCRVNSTQCKRKIPYRKYIDDWRHGSLTGGEGAPPVQLLSVRKDGGGRRV